MNRRVVVVGGGIAGVTVAERLSAALRRSSPTARSPSSCSTTAPSPAASCAPRRSPAGRQSTRAPTPSSTRVPHASDLAARLGLETIARLPGDRGRLRCGTAGSTRSPTGWRSGCPAACSRSSRSRLLSVRGMPAPPSSRCCRAGRTPTTRSGRLVRGRFGDRGARAAGRPAGRQHLRHRHRPLQPGDGAPARRPRAAATQPAARRPRRPITRRVATGPVFAAPAAGMQQLATAAADAAAAARRHRGQRAHGARRRRRRAAVARRRRAGRRRGARHPRRDDRSAARRRPPPDLAAGLGAMDHADVTIVTLAVDGDWPAGLRGHSGYLVPKPTQRLVTAVSFGSQKWAHWRGDGRGAARVARP